MKRWEYFELLNTIYDLMEIDIDATAIINPDYEIVDEEVTVHITKIDVKNNTIVESEEKLPHYTVFNLLKNISPDIKENNFNLN